MEAALVVGLIVIVWAVFRTREKNEQARLDAREDATRFDLEYEVNDGTTHSLSIDLDTMRGESRVDMPGHSERETFLIRRDAPGQWSCKSVGTPGAKWQPMSDEYSTTIEANFQRLRRN